MSDNPIVPIERVETLERLTRYGIEALRDGDGDAMTARATLANLERLAELARERDEARAEVERLRTALGKVPQEQLSRIMAAVEAEVNLDGSSSQ